MGGAGPGQYGKCYSTYLLKRKEEADQQPSSSQEPTLSSRNSIVSLMGPRITWEMSLWA